MAKKHDIIWLDSVDSTNEEAKRHISDIDNLSVLSALEQTKGRGQRGNTWTSAPGENLMFSIVLKDLSLPAHDQFVLNEIASLSVVDFLSKQGITARIKWPNDIYAGSKKICGILIENFLRGSAVSTSIIGIGLNINQRNFGVILPNPTSMVLENRSEGSFDLSSCLNDFMDIFKAYVLRFFSVPAASPSEGKASEDLRRMYLSCLWRMNEPAHFIDYTSLPSGHLEGPMNISHVGSDSATPVFAGHSATEGRQFTGIIRSLSPIGHLMVEDTEKGELKVFAFKEIGYIL